MGEIANIDGEWGIWLERLIWMEMQYVTYV